MTTIRDIARECGVSHQTVANVFHNRAGVRPETRERVQAVMRRLQYTPSTLAQSLAGKHTHMLGVAFPYRHMAGLDGTYFSALQDGFLTSADRWEQNLVLFTAQVWTDERRSLSVYNGGHCDGLLVVAPPTDSDIVSALRRANFPFVVVGDWVETEDVSCVDIDNRAAASDAMTYLLDLGHKRIAVLALDEFLGCNAPRLAGCREAIETHGRIWNDEFVLRSRAAPEQGDWGRLAALMRLPQNERPTAIFCFGDAAAFSAIQMFTEMGLRVPQDVSVLGFNDEPGAAHSSPPLTTVRQPMRAIGERAADILAEQIHRGVPPGRKDRFPTELIVRGSTGAPRI